MDIYQPEPVWIWHHAVHRQFNEQLFYFFIEVKPLNEEKFLDELHTLLFQEFGIHPKGYCLYQVMGEYDYLLRLWLPNNRWVKFQSDAKRITNVHAFSPFQVTDSTITWGAMTSDDPEIDERAARLTPKVVSEAQSFIMKREYNADLITNLRENKLLNQKPQMSVDENKVFVCISEPLGQSTALRKRIIQDLQELILKSKDNFAKPSFYEGMGFTWILMKFEAKKVSQIGELLMSIATRFGHHGISTRSYMVTRVVDGEGDLVSRAALQQINCSESVIKFLPFFGTSEDKLITDARTREEIQTFIKIDLYEANENKWLTDHDRNAIRCFFEAMLLSPSAEAQVIPALAALFPIIAAVENDLRNKMTSAAGRILQAKKNEELSKFLSKFHKEDEWEFDVKRLSLLDVLRCSHFLLKEKVSFDLPHSEELQAVQDGQLQAIVNLRNDVMHAKIKDLEKEWHRVMLDMLNFCHIRNLLSEGFRVFEEEYMKKKAIT